MNGIHWYNSFKVRTSTEVMMCLSKEVIQTDYAEHTHTRFHSHNQAYTPSQDKSHIKTDFHTEGDTETQSSNKKLQSLKLRMHLHPFAEGVGGKDGSH